jgi:hypothetical protein
MAVLVSVHQLQALRYFMVVAEEVFVVAHRQPVELAVMAAVVMAVKRLLELLEQPTLVVELEDVGLPLVLQVVQA